MIGFCSGLNLSHISQSAEREFSGGIHTHRHVVEYMNGVRPRELPVREHDGVYGDLLGYYWGAILVHFLYPPLHSGLHTRSGYILAALYYAR